MGSKGDMVFASWGGQSEWQESEMARSPYSARARKQQYVS